MRNIATCYSEHAVRVSDSYCSGPLNRSNNYVSPKSIPSIKNSVTYTYKANLSFPQKQLFFVTITWCTKLICQGFYITVSENSISLTGPHSEMSQPKGHTCLYSNGGAKIEVYWDLSGATFEAGPEPLGAFYIVIVLVDSETGLLIGDREWDPVDRGLSLRRLTVVSHQYEVFTGQWNNPITTRVRLCDSGPDHEITVRCCPEDDGPKNPVLSVLVDKKRVIRVKRLNWNFRGNQVIFVDGLLVDVMWDVYGWYFDHQNNNNNFNINNNINYNYKSNINNGGGSGLFMFRARSGLDSRLWLEEEEKMKILADKKNSRPEFSLLICASSKKPG